MKYAIKNSFGFTAMTQLVKAQLECLAHIQELREAPRIFGHAPRTGNHKLQPVEMVYNSEAVRVAQGIPAKVWKAVQKE